MALSQCGATKITGDGILVLEWAKLGGFWVWLGWWRCPVLTEHLFPLGFSYEKDTRLYFDDTCVVPERLEGKNPAPEEVWGVTRARGGRLRAGLHSSLFLRPSCAGLVLLQAAEHRPVRLLGIAAMPCPCPCHPPHTSPACTVQGGSPMYLFMSPARGAQPGRGAEPG